MEVYAPDSLAVSPSAFTSARDGDALAGLGDLNHGVDRSAITSVKTTLRRSQGGTYLTAGPDLFFSIGIGVLECY